MKKVLPLGIYFLPALALAASADSIFAKITDILNSIIPIIIGLAVVYFLWGVFNYVTAGSSDDKKTEARNVMIYGIIAIFVMVSVWGLVNLLVDTFGLDNSLPSDIPTIPNN